MAIPSIKADFYVVASQLVSQGGGGLTGPPIGGASVAFSGIVPLNGFNCGNIGSFTSGGFNQDAASFDVADTNCHAGTVTLTGTGGGNWDVSDGNGDSGTCVHDISQSDYCIDGLDVGTTSTSLIKCTSHICD